MPHLRPLFLAFSLVALGACQPAAVPAPLLEPPELARIVEPDGDLAEVAGRPPTAREARAIAELLTLAEEVRDLRFQHSVPFRIQSREVITDFVREQIDDEELEHVRIFYTALGLLEPELDVRELLVRVLGEQIVGYFDTKRGLMVVREDVARRLGASGVRRELGEAEMIIVHELVHALQAQRLGLSARYEEERSIDGDNAFASLVEGDASLAMIGHMARRAGQPLSLITQNAGFLRAVVRDAPPTAVGEEIESAPAIVRLPLLSRYLDGMLFCATLHGQRGWLAVDQAHERPPVSTEQILHPERYLAGEEPIPVSLPDLPELEAAGWIPHDEETLGELELGIWFAQGQPGDRDAAAAEGWGGDRLRVYRDAAGRTAVVWFTIWDDEHEAREAEAAARTMTTRTAAENSQRIERIGRSVLILRDLPPELHAPVHEAFVSFAAAHGP